MEGVANTSCSTNCALAEAAAKSNDKRKKAAAALQYRSSPANDLLDLSFEQAIVIVLSQHLKMHLAERARSRQL
jgi:hypothetical protein